MVTPTALEQRRVHESQSQTKVLRCLNARLSISGAHEDQPSDFNICNAVSLGP